MQSNSHYITGSGRLSHIFNPQVRSIVNSKTITSADAAPASPWVGEWEETRDMGIVRDLVTLAATDETEDGLGGTFTFQFSEDGITATITETRTILDFQTVRDFDLRDVGKYFRVQFEPDRALAGDSVFLTTLYSMGYYGDFVRLATQEIERQNAAMGQTFAYLKGFKADGRSVDIGVTDNLEIFSASSEARDSVHAALGRTGISATAYEVLVDLSDTTNFPHNATGRIDVSYIKCAIDPANNSVGAVRIGVITRIDGTNADISYLFNIPFGKSPARILSINNFAPSQMKMGVTAGALNQSVTNRKDINNAAVNTGVTLNSPRGAATVVPAVGDVLVKYLHTSGSAWDSLVEIFYHGDANAA